MQVLTLSREQFSEQLGNLSQLRNLWRIEALRRVPMLSGLPFSQLTRLANKMTSLTFKAGTTVIAQVRLVDQRC